MPAIMRRLTVISRSAGLYRTQQLKNSELRPVHHSYVLVITKHEGMSQDWLSKKLCISKSNVTRHIAFLEKNGYVERKADEKDKRQTLVYPTQKMLDIYPEIRRITDEWNTLVSDTLTDEEIEAFHTIVKKMIDRSLEIIER